MKTLIESNDIIYISWVKSLLSYHGVNFLVLDESMSSTEGNISAIPIRILVNESQLIFAEKLISKDKNI